MDHHLLVSELQALIVEAKRRHPDVKDASEKALEILRTGQASKEILKNNADTMLSPITLGCKTKTPKIIGIAITALQRLVATGGVPTTSLPLVLQTLSNVSSQGVDIQLKILQALLSILTYNPDAHGEILGHALLLCFKLQDVRVSVVSSTAAATLRQAVMLIFDRISADPTPSPGSGLMLALPTDPPTETEVSPAVMDAYCILSDLCLLTARSGGSGLLSWGGGDKEKPKLLTLSNLQRTFGLELIESILSGYEEPVKQRPELVQLLSHSLDSLLLKLLAEKPTFPIALRVCRLIFLLIRSFSAQLPRQVQGYISTLIKLGMGEIDEDSTRKDVVQPWFRVLALEIIRGICGDNKLLQSLYYQYDRQGEPIFATLVASLGRLTSEKPNLLGVSDQMRGLGVPSGDGPNAGYLDIGFGMVATAANVGVSTVSSMMGSQEGGLGPQSSLKLKLIEQHDKAEAPLIPETYIYLLALQSLNSVASGIHSAAKTLSPTLVGMAESAWPALLAALSFTMATNLSDTLFAEVLSALQDFTIACNTLSLWTPRNAFLNTLGRYAVPPPVVSAMQSYLETGAGRKESVISTDGLGSVLGGRPAPCLSERNLACLKSTVTTAKHLAGDLDTAWHDVLEVLQNASFMLGAKRPSVTRRGTVASPRIGSSPLRTRDSIDDMGPRSEVFEGIDTEDISIAINVLFDSTTQMDDKAFTTFLSALCQLSSEMVGSSNTQTNANASTASLEPPETPRLGAFPMSPNPDNRRRTSGITVSSSAKSGEKSFSLGKLRTVGMLNLNRLVNSDPEAGWGILTRHLLSLARDGNAPSTVRVQSSETLGEILLASLRIAKDDRIQYPVFAVLGKQVDAHPISSLVSTDYDVRSAGYHTLNQILESSGHSLQVGWTTIFGMLNDACCSTTPTAFKGDANLVRIAFPSLNLICTDFLSSLDHDAMRQCIACLGYFGRQGKDVNITLSAIGLMWNVSDAVQADSKDLWLELLLQLLGLGRDSRTEVQNTAMQTLYKCIELYGSTLSTQLWEEVWWKVVYPLLETSSSDSQVLALISTGSIYKTFAEKLSTLSSYDKLSSTLLDQIQVAFDIVDKNITIASLKALESVLVAKPHIDGVWNTFTHMGESIRDKTGYTQESLLALVRISSLLHDQSDLDESHQTQFSNILCEIMTYSTSPEYRPDMDIMSQLQKSIFDLLSSSSKLNPALILSEMSTFSLLAFEDIHASQQKARATYIAVSKACMPRIPKLMRGVLDAGIDGETVIRVLKAYETPIRLRYGCPPSCRFNDDTPLWRTAMQEVMGVVKVAVNHAERPGGGTSDTDKSEIWSSLIDLFEAWMLADISTQSAEDETFVISTLDKFKQAAIEPFMGSVIPSTLIQRYSEILSKASVLYKYDVTPSIGGTTGGSTAVSSQRLAYWSLDLLIESTQSNPLIRDESDSGIVKWTLPALMTRCEETLRHYVNDVHLRGSVPLARVRQEELLYVLQKLATLRIHSRDSDRDATLQGRKHLFQFYPFLLELSFMEHSVPSMWITSREYDRLLSDAGTNGQGDDDEGDLVEITSRDLTKRCLELIGRELGLGQVSV